MRGQHAAPLTAFVAVAALCATIVAQGLSAATIPFATDAPTSGGPSAGSSTPVVLPAPADRSALPGLSSVRVPGRAPLAPGPLSGAEDPVRPHGPAVVSVPDYFTADPRAGLSGDSARDPRPLLVLPGLLGAISSPPPARSTGATTAPPRPTPAPTTGSPSTPPPSPTDAPSPTPTSPATEGGSSEKPPSADPTSDATGTPPAAGQSDAGEPSATASDD